MNRIYRVVWCHVRNTYVVASELASRKKVKSSKNSTSKKGLLIGAALSAILLVGTANATITPVLEEGVSVVAGAEDVNNASSMAIDTNDKSSEGEEENKTLTSNVNDGLVILNNDKTQIVLNKSQFNENQKSVSFVLGLGAQAKDVMDTYDHKIDDENTITKIKRDADDNIIMRPNTKAIVMGNQAIAHDENSIAIGDGAESAFDSVVLGFGATASTILQKPVEKLDPDEIPDRAYGMVAVGANSKAEEKNASAIGHRAKAIGTANTAIGGDSSAIGSYSTAIGGGAQALRNNSIAIGAASYTSGDSAISIGMGAQATEGSSSAIGTSAMASGYGAAAIGSGSIASKHYSTAIGFSASATGENSIAIGANSVAVDDKTVSFGHDAIPAKGEDKAKEELNRRLIHVAEGLISESSKEAINGSQLFTAKKDLADIIAEDIIMEDGSIKAPTFIETIQVVQKDAEGKPVLDDQGNPVLVDQKQDGFNTIKEAVDSLGQGNATLVDSLGGGATVNADGTITGPTYVINGGDYNNVGDAITNIDGRVIDNSKKIENVTNGKAGLVKLGDNKIVIDNEIEGASAATVFDFSNTKGELRTLDGIKEGWLDENSNQAVTGRQLHKTNLQIDEIEVDLSTMGDSITNVEEHITEIYEGKAGLVKLSDSGNAVVIDNELAKKAQTFNIGNEGGETRVLTGVRAGEISHDSTDAVNGGQIHYFAETAAKHLGGNAEAVMTKDGKYIITDPNFAGAFGFEGEGAPIINNVYKGFEYINDEIGKFEAGEAGLLQMKDGKLVFSDVAKKATEFDVSGENGAMKVTNVAAGKVSEDSLEAINGSQLYTTNKSIVDSLGGDAGVNEDGSIKGPTYTFIDKDEDGKNIVFNDVGSALENLDGRVVKNTGDINTINQNISNITTGKAGLLQIDSSDRIVFDSSIAGGRTFDISNGGQARKMTGVAAGVDSNDAVNVSQLNDITTALGGNSSINKDTGKVTSPNYSEALGLEGDNAIKEGVEAGFEYVGNKLTNHEDRITNIEGDITNITNGTAGIVQLETDKDGKQKLVIDNNLASKADTFDIANGEEGRTLTGVADGEIAADSKDAINGSQLHASNKTIADIFGSNATVDKDGFISMPEYDFGDDNKFNNVGDSLAHLNNKIKNGEGGLFQMSADGKTVVLGDTAKTATSVDMGNRVIAGVANGKVEKGSLEAVNGGQLWETNQKVASNTNQIKHINNTLNHYNTRLNNIEKTVHENRKRASAGTASAMAMSSIPYLDYAKYSFGMGVASYDGEAAMSMGLEFRMGDNGRFRIQGSYDTQNKAGVGVGMAFEL